jgi:hypothetical protein
VALPMANRPAASGWLSDLENAGIQVLALERANDLVHALGLALPAAAAASDDRRTGSRSTRRKYAYLGGAGIATLAAAFAGITLYPWDDRPIVLTLPKAQYVVGEPFVFTVRANKDCQFLVLTVDALGKPTLHDPAVEGTFMGDLVLKAREQRRIPVQGMAVVEPPAGTYQIAAVCNTDELARLGLAGSAPKSSRRNFGFKAQDSVYTVDRDELDKLAVTYSVKDK